ncbi:penicillin acylase family protein [Mucilaginibacter sp. L3T2-6]|uniref:penicillin acylase family protein n=1 Tax=Mucilaginibacter sp. L3T2-6 TaxID=3062491 RepID=UPI002674ED63|nr:penicillin acylase family protein [Mucilaginibacter sp. L3T2-6]MDO3640587.1 penicillin acylase family protein [Mucilaginibacter sp. L3T2-6]MDV6213074.1 penicillin acylase family protein [Mucilaginibacter sp. L3T2-6]
MKKQLIAALVLFPLIAVAQKFTAKEILRFRQQAAAVTIVRDNWGIPHVYGKTDADAVFGLMYAECEDNFKGIEQNYLYQLGRQSELDGGKNIFTDVQLQLIADTVDAIKEYRAAAPWFRKLLDAFADGVNYYLYTHPDTKPAVFQRFEPWYALMFTDGSVSATVTGGIKLTETRKFYGDGAEKLGAVHQSLADDRETGSNGFAIAPVKSASGHAMLYINPHVPFYFRAEVQMVSQEGLNVYGAVTWGQFFVYQGFNQHCGWMHTSSSADVGDLYAEKVTQKDGKWYYEYDGRLKPVRERKLVMKINNGVSTERKVITGYYTHHGPILGARDGRWLALRANNRSYNALVESWLITKANTFAGYKKAMGLLQNATNNTVYADDKGNIAFWYGNFMPRRDPVYDWRLPVDGSIPATEWKGLHSLEEQVHIYNPPSGWIQNCNSTPFASSGKFSPAKDKYPAYMAPDGQNYRAVNAIRLLDDKKKLSLDDLISKGYDHYLAAFDVLLPPLFEAYESAPDSLKQRLESPVDTMKHWDKYSAANSVATSIAVEWGTLVMRQLPPPKTDEESTYQTDRIASLMKTLTSRQQLELFLEAINNLKKQYGTWQTMWGDINRYQRPADGVTFSDTEPSLPVGAVSSAFGQLPSFQSRTMKTRKRYGYSGNSFIAAVEFGTRIKAKTVITGGESFDPASKHYTDQAGMYIDGRFKDVLFYKADVLKHAERTYHPGD